MNSKDYWAQREAEALKHYITDEKEYTKQLHQIYSNMLDACQKEIDSFYGKYARAEGISIAEAKKRVSKLDIAAYERKAKKYVKEKDFSAKANEEMRLYNATMKINRLEMLKANIGLELIAGHDELEKFMGGILKGRTQEELKRQAGILGKTVKNNAAKANAIVNASFHNGKFSDRIWQYQDLMREDLGRLLQTGLIQGKNPRAIAKDLRKYWYGNDPLTGGGATYCMERLMRTELARVQTEAQKQSFERNGFDMYEFIVNGGCCPVCKALRGKHFKVDKMMPGTNAPPMHPNCRCSTAAYEDSDEYEAWLEHLANGGTTEEWNKKGKESAISDVDKSFKKPLEKSGKSSTIKSEFSEADKKAIFDYMSAKAYNINEKLRTGATLDTEEQKLINALDAALKKAPTYSGNLSRSLYFNSADDVAAFMKDYQPGNKVTFKEFISTTKGSKLYNPAGQVQIFIKDSKRGRDISSLNPGEEEVLYERDSAFIVENIVEQGGKYYILVVENNE